MDPLLRVVKEDNAVDSSPPIDCCLFGAWRRGFLDGVCDFVVERTTRKPSLLGTVGFTVTDSMTCTLELIKSTRQAVSDQAVRSRVLNWPMQFTATSKKGPCQKDRRYDGTRTKTSLMSERWEGDLEEWLRAPVLKSLSGWTSKHVWGRLQRSLEWFASPRALASWCRPTRRPGERFRSLPLRKLQFSSIVVLKNNRISWACAKPIRLLSTEADQIQTDIIK